MGILPDIYRKLLNKKRDPLAKEAWEMYEESTKVPDVKVSFSDMIKVFVKEKKNNKKK